MKAIVIKIKLHCDGCGGILNEISKILERYLKRKGILFHSIDVAVKFDENE